MDPMRVRSILPRLRVLIAQNAHQRSNALPVTARPLVHLVLQHHQVRIFVHQTKNMYNNNNNLLYFPQQPLLSFLAAEGTTVGFAPLGPDWTDAFLRITPSPHTHFCMISRAMVMKAVSTLVLFLAEVSTNSMPRPTT